MSPEVWLRPNRRVLTAGIVTLAVLLAGGIFLIATSGHVGLTALGWVVSAVLACLIAMSVRAAIRPRLGFEDDCLLVFLGSPQPQRVPIELVECFFLGQGPSLLPAPATSADKDSPESSTIVVRLAESAEEWKHFDVRPSLGLWCDGYITIRGTWCEPINAECLKRLNHRLVETHRRQRREREQESA